MPKKPLVIGAPPRTPLGELTTLPTPPSRLGRGIPFPDLSPLVTCGASTSRLRRLPLGASIFAHPCKKILAAPMPTIDLYYVPNWLRRDFFSDLAGPLCAIYNASVLAKASFRHGGRRLTSCRRRKCNLQEPSKLICVPSR